MKGAVIDLGTNTFSLLIFEQIKSDYRVLATDKSFVNLGEGGINKNIIQPIVLERAYEVIARFSAKCHEFNIKNDHIKAVGTSALRNAHNTPPFIKKVADEFRISIHLINGIQEAELVFKAVNSIHDFHSNLSCIMDIGGGSTEFTLVENGSVSKFDSFKIGLSRMIQKRALKNPLTETDIQVLIQFLDDTTEDSLTEYEVNDLIGVGGSFETFYSMIQRTLDIDYHQSYILPQPELTHVLDYLIHSSLEERMENPWIVDFRKRMINVAALKTKWALKQTKAERCYFSPSSLKEGLLIKEFIEK